jgi:hypothetical protein
METHPFRREHTSWRQMLDRCSNPKNKGYSNYGGKGIAVCSRWESFEAFLEDMGPRPSAAHSLDRIDSEGDYEPGNCRWATKKEQARNRSTNHWIEHGGRKMVLSDWALFVGLNKNTLCERFRRGWSTEEALTLRKGERRKKKT